MEQPRRPDQDFDPPAAAVAAGGRAGTFRGFLVIVIGGNAGRGIFLYSGAPATGNLIGSWTSQAGTDAFGNSFPAGINVTSGQLAGVIVSALQETLNPGPWVLQAPSDQTISVFTTPGSNNWTAPAGVTSVAVYAQGPGNTGGAGVASGFGGGGGGGGEFAFEGTVAVTPATVYHPTVGAPGSSTTFAGDVVTVTAHSGSAGAAGTSASPGTGGAGGTGSTNSLHFDGGPGGKGGTAANSGGGGGGGGASSAQAGNAGQAGPSSGAGGAGGLTAPGFEAGGAGGTGGLHGTNAGVTAGTAPGGGGGGGGDGGAHSGGGGANGKIALVYSTGAQSTFLAAATAAFTDPVSGLVFQPGFTTVDPVFGDIARFFGANVAVAGSATWVVTGASLDIATIGAGLRVAEGSNAKQGTANLSGGTVVVSTTAVTANSRIFLTAQTSGAAPGALRVSARTAGTSFTITSTSATDTSTVAWEIFEPG